MNQKQIGIIIIIVGILLSSFVFMAKIKEDKYIAQLTLENGSCFLENGECLHDGRNYTLYIFGWALSLALIVFGVYLAFFDKTQKVLAEHQLKVSSALKEAKESEVQKDEFKAFLSGFSYDEQQILKAINEQEGITQSTLRYKTGLSKTGLSLILKALEEKDIIARKASGKTNEVYLKKKF